MINKEEMVDNLEECTNETLVFDDDCEYTDDMPVRSKKQGDTLATATKKAIAQLQASLDYLTNASETLEAPATYKEFDGVYTVGVKYANKYLVGVFKDSKYKFVKVKGKDACVAKLRQIIAQVRDGRCNAALKAAIQANVKMHANRKTRA